MDVDQVTTLIFQAKYVAADQAWKDLVASLGTPSEEHLLVFHDVAMAWLELGELRRAREALKQGGPLYDHPALAELKEEISQFEEAQYLGYGLRPHWLKGDERWKPQLLPAINAAGHARARWYAGRIESVEANGSVELIFATTDVPLDRCRVLRKRLSARAWREHSGWYAQVARFVEVGEYLDGTIIRMFPLLYCATH